MKAWKANKISEKRVPSETQHHSNWEKKVDDGNRSAAGGFLEILKSFWAFLCLWTKRNGQFHDLRNLPQFAKRSSKISFKRELKQSSRPFWEGTLSKKRRYYGLQKKKQQYGLKKDLLDISLTWKLKKYQWQPQRKRLVIALKTKALQNNNEMLSQLDPSWLNGTASQQNERIMK